MTPELANAALHFLARCDLKGAETPAFMQVVEALQVLAQPQPSHPVDKPVVKAMPAHKAP